jgi:hypothetical protein
MLHVTNGSVFLSRLHDLGVPGRVVPWDDVLHEGPVPADPSWEELRRVRAEFLASGWGDVADVERSLEARDRAVMDAMAGDEVVLWFEHDLYDQLHVLQVLDLLQPVRPGQAGAASAGARVTAILADDYLAAQSDGTLAAWFAARQPLSREQWAASAEAWACFRAPDPARLSAFDHPGAWTSLRAALRRHLQQFPSVRTGLSRTEAQTLAGIAAGPLAVRDAFRAANHTVEEAIFMGDAGWWWHVRPLLTSSHPLLRIVGEAPGDMNHPDWWRDDASAPRLALTDTGARVMAGEVDHVALNGIDRWLGGVHLVAEPVSGVGSPVSGQRAGAIWRWDETAARLVRT